jgi:hypothetical protein
MRTSRKSKGLAGVFVALILFGLVFTVAASYFLFTNQTAFGTDQAYAARQDALQLGRLESLILSPVLSGNTLTLSVNNAGGIPASIASIYLSDTSGDMISPPGLMGQSVTNFTAAQWPLTLNPGASTLAMTGCVSGKTGCSIKANLGAYSYSSGTTVYINVVTVRGNVFSTRYPQLSGGVSSNPLVVTLFASPSQVFSCMNCITVTVTAYNFASNPIVGVTLEPTPPGTPTASWTNGASGTSVYGGSCQPAAPSSTIPAYSGSGNPPSITFTCKFSTKTGTVGGFASFSVFAQGTLSGKSVTSAIAVSNNVQIGGTSSVSTQGAFSVNFFFFKSSSCQQASGNWVQPCSIPAFTKVNNLPQSATISAGSSHYVAFYVNVTNNYPATLEILQYTFLQLDASHPPPVVGNESDFWLSGSPSTYNAKSYYYPNYGASPPSLAPYTGNEITCAEPNPPYTPSPNCIDIAQGQTMTLTLAACGYGASNWDWGGIQYAKNFDSSVGCTSSAPAFSPSGAANILTLTICFMYQGQIYTQAIQFQGLAVIP